MSATGDSPDLPSARLFGEEPSVELVRRARNGDRQALGRLLERHMPSLRRWAHGRLPFWARDRVDTDDIVQDTLVRTLQNLEHFEHRGDGALHAYLRQVLRNRVRDELRRTQRSPRKTSLPSGAPDRRASPLEEAIGRDACRIYEEGLARLGEDDREAIVARIEMVLSYEELARVLGKPSADAARMTVNRALIRLAREMSQRA